jgi:GTPase Era involved in 16S rRNA processing
MNINNENFDIEEKKDIETDRIVIFGQTGSGKSFLANKVFGCEEFEFSNSLSSHTLKPMSCKVEMPGTNHKIIVVDTPGFKENRRLY